MLILLPRVNVRMKGTGVGHVREGQHMHVSNSRGRFVHLHNRSNIILTQLLPKKLVPEGGRKLQVHARLEKKYNAEKIIGGKRCGEDHLELLSKRRLVSKDDGSSSFSMVEVVCQPCQSQ